VRENGDKRVLSIALGRLRRKRSDRSIIDKAKAAWVGAVRARGSAASSSVAACMD
jgi:hypothetical protein